MLDMNQQINDIVVIPLVHSVLYKEHYKKLDVKKNLYLIFKWKFLISVTRGLLQQN